MALEPERLESNRHPDVRILQVSSGHFFPFMTDAH